MTARGVLVWLICALFFLYEFMLRTILGTIQLPLMKELHISVVEFALISSTAYQIMYGVMQIPVGIIADRYGLKRTLLFAALVCSVGNLGFCFVHDFKLALLFRLMMGLGASFGFVGLLLAVYDWLPRKNIALFIGLSQFLGTLGPMLAAGPLKALLVSNIIGWRGIFSILAIIGSLIAILILFFVDKNKQVNSKFYILSKPVSILSNLQRLIRQKQIWWIGLYSASVYFSIEYLSENEGITFLMHKGFSPTFSAYLITVSWLGYAVGCPILGYLSDKLKQRKPLMLYSAVLVLISLSMIIYLPLNQLMMMCSFFLLGIGASGPSISFAIVSEHCEDTDLSVGLAFTNALITFFSALCAPLISMMLIPKSQTAHLLANYQQTFSIMIGFAFISFLVCRFMIKETFCKSVAENTILAPQN